MGVGRGSRGDQAPLGFEVISKKRLFFQFRGVKTNFTTFGSLLENNLGKSPTTPPGKNPSDAHACSKPISTTFLFLGAISYFMLSAVYYDACLSYQMLI